MQPRELVVYQGPGLLVCSDEVGTPAVLAVTEDIFGAVGHDLVNRRIKLHHPASTTLTLPPTAVLPWPIATIVHLDLDTIITVDRTDEMHTTMFEFKAAENATQPCPTPALQGQHHVTVVILLDETTHLSGRGRHRPRNDPGNHTTHIRGLGAATATAGGAPAVLVDVDIVVWTEQHPALVRRLADIAGDSNTARRTVLVSNAMARPSQGTVQLHVAAGAIITPYGGAEGDTIVRLADAARTTTAEDPRPRTPTSREYIRTAQGTVSFDPNGDFVAYTCAVCFGPAVQDRDNRSRVCAGGGRHGHNGTGGRQLETSGNQCPLQGRPVDPTNCDILYRVPVTLTTAAGGKHTAQLDDAAATALLGDTTTMLKYWATTTPRRRAAELTDLERRIKGTNGTYAIKDGLLSVLYIADGTGATHNAAGPAAGFN